MRYTVIYYTRTKNCQRIAEKIANALGCEVIQITDPIDWDGSIGFIKAGYYSSNNKPVEIIVHGDISGADELILVTPLWAGGIANAARSFIDTVPREKIHLVVASIGNRIKDREGFQSVSDITKVTRNEDQVINTLVSTLE